MSSNEEMKAFFDRLAPGWTDNTADYAIRDRIVELMDLPEGGVIADIGCGKGVMFEHLLKTNPQKIIGVDLSGEMLKGAKELFSDHRISYVNADILDAPLPELDAAILFNSYPHFMDKRALAEKLAKHVHQEGGIVAIAHSGGRTQINERHREGMAAALSSPLRPAETEAADFAPHFAPEILIDSDEFYFIKLRRNA